MSIINFTAQYDLFGSFPDSDDEGLEADLGALVGTVKFTPQTIDGRAISAPTYSPRPAGFKMLPFAAYIDTDGQLKDGPSGNVGVRLWANDPVFELDDLLYRVDFDVKTIYAQPVIIDPGYFFAPVDDRVINLSEVLQSGESIGSPRLIGGTFVAGTVIFEDLGGGFLEPITIPNGVLVFVDNGDATWSVG